MSVYGNETLSERAAQPPNNLEPHSMFSLDDLMYNSDYLLDSPERTRAEPAAAEERDAAWVASHCGACFDAGESFGHVCKLKAVQPDHVVPLHSALACNRVVQPIEGYCFCDMSCLHAYNWEKEKLDIVEVMPDDGIPRGRTEYDFQLPARRGPGETVELPPWAAVGGRGSRRRLIEEDEAEYDDAEAEAEAASPSNGRGSGGDEAELESVPADDAEGSLVTLYTRVVIDGEHGVVVAILGGSGAVAVAYDHREHACPALPSNALSVSAVSTLSSCAGEDWEFMARDTFEALAAEEATAPDTSAAVEGVIFVPTETPKG